jgi:hypothetical protein
MLPSSCEAKAVGEDAKKAAVKAALPPRIIAEQQTRKYVKPLR